MKILPMKNLRGCEYDGSLTAWLTAKWSDHPLHWWLIDYSVCKHGKPNRGVRVSK